jgi:hypothetical protein
MGQNAPKEENKMIVNKSKKAPGRTIFVEIPGVQIAKDIGYPEYKNQIFIDIDDIFDDVNIEYLSKYLNILGFDIELKINKFNNHIHEYVKFVPFYTEKALNDIILNVSDKSLLSDIKRINFYVKNETSYRKVIFNEVFYNVIKNRLIDEFKNLNISIDENFTKKDLQTFSFDRPYETYKTQNTDKIEEITKIFANYFEINIDEFEVEEIEEIIFDIYRKLYNFARKHKRKAKIFLPFTDKYAAYRKKIKYVMKEKSKNELIKIIVNILFILYHTDFMKKGQRQTNWGAFLLFIRKYWFSNLNDTEIYDIFQKYIIPKLIKNNINDEEIHKRLDWLLYCDYNSEKNGGFNYLKEKLETNKIDIFKLFDICENKSLTYIKNNIEKILEKISFKSENTNKRKNISNRKIDKIEFSDKEIVKRYNHRKIRNSGTKTKIKIIDIEHFIFVLLTYIIINNKSDYYNIDYTNKQYSFNIPFKYIRLLLSNYFSTNYTTTENIHKAILNIKKKNILTNIDSIKPGRDRYLICSISFNKFDKLYNSFLIDIETNFIRLIGYNNNTYDKYEPYHIKDNISNFIYKTFINFTISFLLSNKEEKINLFNNLLNILSKHKITTLLDDNEFVSFINTTYRISYNKTKKSNKIVFTNYDIIHKEDFPFTSIKNSYLSFISNNRNYQTISNLLNNRHNHRKTMIKSIIYSIVLFTTKVFSNTYYSSFIKI